jgi:hypothetical protein
VLPDPDDVLGRGLSFYAALPVRRAGGVGDVPGGVAVLDPALPSSRDDNRPVLTEPVDGATIRVLRGFADIVDQREVHEFWARSRRSGLADLDSSLDQVVEQLVGREQLNDRVMAVTDLVIRDEGRVVAGGTATPSWLGRAASRRRSAATWWCKEAVTDDWPHHWYARRGSEVVGTMWAADRSSARLAGSPRTTGRSRQTGTRTARSR